MSPFISNNLIFSSLILFIVVSIASNTLNYMSVQTNNDALEQSEEVITYIKNITENSQKISQQNNELLQLLEDRLIG
jgi:hypothetical protein